MTPPCKNCDHPLEAAFAFCPGCGQKTTTRRLQLSEILHDFWTQFTDIDRGLFTLLRDLVVRPGIVASEYIAGRRRKHFGPLNFYLIVGTTLIVSMNVTEWIHAKSERASKGTAQTATHPTPDSGVVPDQTVPYPGKPQSPTEPGSTDGGSRIMARRQAVSQFWTQYSDFVSIAAAPLLCVFYWLLYRQSGFNYTELLVACLYMIGFSNLVYALVASPVTAFLSSSRQTTYAITGVFKLFEIGYFTFFYFQLTHGKVRRPLLRALLSSVLVAVLWTVTTFALVAVYIMTGFGVD